MFKIPKEIYKSQCIFYTYTKFEASKFVCVYKWYFLQFFLEVEDKYIFLLQMDGPEAESLSDFVK